VQICICFICPGESKPCPCHLPCVVIYVSCGSRICTCPQRNRHLIYKERSSVQTVWSGRRDSNPRHLPWQGSALPTEPLPLNLWTLDGRYLHIRSTKVRVHTYPFPHHRIISMGQWAVRDSNSHGSSPTDPKSVLSTNFSNRPLLQRRKIQGLTVPTCG
jgi:hypothetical protein